LILDRKKNIGHPHEILQKKLFFAKTLTTLRAMTVLSRNRFMQITRWQPLKMKKVKWPTMPV